MISFCFCPDRNSKSFRLRSVIFLRFAAARRSNASQTPHWITSSGFSLCALALYQVPANDTDTGTCSLSNSRSFVAYLPFEVSSTASKSNTIACGYVLVLFVGTSYREMLVFPALDQFKTNRENRLRSPQSALVHHLPCEPPFRFSYFFGYCFFLSLRTILLIMIITIIIIIIIITIIIVVGFYGALKEFSMRLQ